MTEIEKATVPPDRSIRNVMETIANSALQVAVVIDEEQKLLGVVTDGDIRRGIIEGVDLEDDVREVMNEDPIIARTDDEETSILKVMKARNIHQVPIVDEENRLVDLEILDDLIQPDPMDNWVVLVAGGLGTRLRPITEDRPKPLVEVGDQPILENILQNFVDQGFHKFYFTVNYKAEMIKDHFGDGSHWDATIRYYEEEKRLGTAGALGSLSLDPDEPIVVMNSDLITEVSFSSVVEFHDEHDSAATMCARKYEHQIPYGVIETEEHKIKDLEEKPTESWFVNAGMYVLDPEVMSLVPEDEYYEMTELFEEVVSRGLGGVVYPVTEYWHDIAREEDLKKVLKESPDIIS